MLGLYPVARVNGEFVLYRTYGERANGMERFETKNRMVSGGDSLTQEEQQEIQRIILQSLVAERIFEQYTEEHTALSGVGKAADVVVERTLKDADPDVLPQATKEVYGWSLEEFSKHVLYPRAFQNELKNAIESSGVSFEEFEKTQLTNAEISLYTVPWKWENGQLVSR